jgi:hypothetical protein
MPTLTKTLCSLPSFINQERSNLLYSHSTWPPHPVRWAAECKSDESTTRQRLFLQPLPGPVPIHIHLPAITARSRTSTILLVIVCLIPIRPWPRLHILLASPLLFHCLILASGILSGVCVFVVHEFDEVEEAGCEQGTEEGPNPVDPVFALERACCYTGPERADRVD